jgi:hypothetical protein
MRDARRDQKGNGPWSSVWEPCKWAEKRVPIAGKDQGKSTRALLKARPLASSSCSSQSSLPTCVSLRASQNVVLLPQHLDRLLQCYFAFCCDTHQLLPVSKGLCRGNRAMTYETFAGITSFLRKHGFDSNSCDSPSHSE